MNPTTKSKILFIFCIITRAFFAYFAKNNLEFLPLMSKVAFLIATGFTLIYIFGLRKSGGETFGELIWWNDLRPVHATLYYAFAVSAFLNKEHSWLFLAMDVSLGTAAFVKHRFL